MNLPTQEPFTVAVVDDDLPTLELIGSMLQSIGYRVMTFESAAALAAARRSQTFHALVMDLAMPDVDGFELLYLLAEKSPLEPVIISSSLPNNILQAALLVCQSLNLRVLGILSKPFATDELALLLRPHTLAQLAG
jgi:CheY-like chemotaxis protein